MVVVAVVAVRNLFQLWSQRQVVDIKRHNYIFCDLFQKQTHCSRAGINIEVRQTDLDQQARHLLVSIFENLEATLRITLAELRIPENNRTDF